MDQFYTTYQPSTPPSVSDMAPCGRIGRELSQNLQHNLWDRESALNRQNSRGIQLPSLLSYERLFHKSITPNLTIQNVDKALVYIRKFTPDGRSLLAIAQDQRSLEVYEYRGVGSVAALFAREQSERITATDRSADSLRIRQQVFDQLFRLQSSVRIAVDGRHARCLLNREFSIFLHDGHYVLLGAMSKNAEMFTPRNYIFDYPDLYLGFEISDYTFFLIDLRERGQISDVYKFRRDNILLSHNSGVSVHGSTIAVLSRCRQVIELLELQPDGKLVPLYAIGPHYIDAHEQVPRNGCGGLTPISFLKHSILVHLYRGIVESSSGSERARQLSAFYKSFEIYENMLMAKMQLIDADHLFIRFEERPKDFSSIDYSPYENTSGFMLYVFYCITDQKVLKVCSKSSVELLYLHRNYCDSLCHARSLQTSRAPSSPCNNIYVRANYDSVISSIRGGEIEAARRFNPALPVSSQSFATSQYLDCHLFKFDDRLISAFERPKVYNLEPICFRDRHTNITKFRLFLGHTSDDCASQSSAAGNGNGNGNGNVREMVAFVFHPYEPFILSMQRVSARYVVNFHIYNESTVVKQ